MAYCCYRFLRFLSKRYSLRLSHSSMSKYVTGEKLLLSINGILNMHLYDKQTIINLFFLICSLVTRPDNCSFINGEYLKSGLEKLEKWCCETKEEVIPSTVSFLFFRHRQLG